MAYPSWVAPQAMDPFGGFRGGFEIGAQLGSEQSAREGFGQYADWLAQQNGQFARPQPMGFLGSMGQGGAQPSPQPQAPSNGALSGSFDAVQGATDPQLSGILNSLAGTESSGNFSARNNEVGSGGARGHFGRLQFGQARLQDAMRAGAIPQGTTPEQFLANPNLQQAAENWHLADLNRQIGTRGLDRYIGQTVGGVPITRDGIIAMAHLGGIGGAERYLTSGGQYNPADAYGTSLSSYAQRHGNAGAGAPIEVGSPAVEAATTMAQAGNGSPAMAFAVPGSPPAPSGTLPPPEVMNALFRSPETRQMAISLAQTAQQGMQPPEFTQFQREDGSVWQLNVRSGHMQVLQGGTGPGAASFSQTPVFLRDPDGNQHIAQISSNGGILVNGQVMQGLPEGWSVTNRPQGMSSVDLGGSRGVFDPNTGEYHEGPAIQGSPSANLDVAINPDGTRTMTPAAGSPQALEAAAADEQARMRDFIQNTYSDIVIEDIDRALENITSNPMFNTGPGAAATQGIPGTPAFNTRQLMDTIRANVGFDRLQQMREASPTGGALGAVSEFENRLLQSTLGNLELSQDLPQLQRNLERLRDIYMRIVNFGITPDDPVAQEIMGSSSSPAQSQPSQPQPEAQNLVQTEITPQRFHDNPTRYQGQTPPDDWTGDRNLWPYMTPETRALWQ